MKTPFRKKSLLEKIEYRFLPREYKDLDNSCPMLEIRQKGILKFKTGWENPALFLRRHKIKNFTSETFMYHWAKEKSKTDDERDALAYMLNDFCKIVRESESTRGANPIETGKVVEFYTIENI